MDKKVILAVAGAGKTYTICNSLDENKRNLLIAYTHQNINNIKRELVEAYGRIPEKTEIMTFHSFVNQMFLLPFEPIILDYFSASKFKSTGITTHDPPPQQLKRNGCTFANPKYCKDSTLEHYVLGSQYYCSLLTKLIIKTNTKNNKLFKRAMAGLTQFFDAIYVDEFQDFRENDYAFLDKVIKSSVVITVVGDYYQHSVSGLNNSGKPFKHGKKDVSYADYIVHLSNMHLEIDENSLICSRRCLAKICRFVSHKLGINIASGNGHVGDVYFLHEYNEVQKILSDDAIAKLVFNNAKEYGGRYINWGYSKGDTYPTVCVILTDAFCQLENEGFRLSKQSVSTVNKLYVAMTRTKGDLYLLTRDVFDDVYSRLQTDEQL